MTGDPKPVARRDDSVVWTLAATPGEPGDSSLLVPVVFRQQPRPLDARHRVAYRTALLMLILNRFNRSAARLDNLHLLTWATRSGRTRAIVQSWWAGRRPANIATQRLDPDLQVTLNLTLVDGLIHFTGARRDRVELTENGKSLARLIEDEPSLLDLEKHFLGSLGQLSDSKITRVLGGSL